VLLLDILDRLDDVIDNLDGVLAILAVLLALAIALTPGLDMLRRHHPRSPLGEILRRRRE
jgi:hypothetical protein